MTSIDPADRGRELRDRVVAEVLERFPTFSVELNVMTVPGTAAYFSGPEDDGLNIEFLAWASWSYTLFVGTRTWVEELPMNETKDARVARIVQEITTAIERPELAPKPPPLWPLFLVLVLIGLPILAYVGIAIGLQAHRNDMKSECTTAFELSSPELADCFKSADAWP